MWVKIIDLGIGCDISTLEAGDDNQLPQVVHNERHQRRFCW